MLSIDQAVAALLGRATPLPAGEIPLHESLGLVLAEDVAADVDLPPFDKALMDGYAIRSADLAGPGEHALQVIEEVTAGRVPSLPVNQGEATRIMTGAPLPRGADAVVMHERTQMHGESTVIIPGPVLPGGSVLHRGREMKAGETLLRAGALLNAAKLGLIASAGRRAIRVIPRPRIAVVPTGDELVPVDQVPGPGQIRNTNGITLAALARDWGAVDVIERPIAPDDPILLREHLAGALASSDVLIVSGGVSAGTKDLVPSTLIDLGVEAVFHQVKVKPGKPIWFGVAPTGGLVFGLPGNPASGVVGFLLFVRSALDALAGRPPRRAILPGVLASRFVQKGDRPTYFPAAFDDGRITPLDWSGSSDLRTVALADGFAIFPPGDRSFEAGESLDFLPIA